MQKDLGMIIYEYSFSKNPSLLKLTTNCPEVSVGFIQVAHESSKYCLRQLGLAKSSEVIELYEREEGLRATNIVETIEY